MILERCIRCRREKAIPAGLLCEECNIEVTESYRVLCRALAARMGVRVRR